VEDLHIEEKLFMEYEVPDFSKSWKDKLIFADINFFADILDKVKKDGAKSLERDCYLQKI
jgi:hypothetical protein